MLWMKYPKALSGCKDRFLNREMLQFFKKYWNKKEGTTPSLNLFTHTLNYCNNLISPISVVALSTTATFSTDISL